MLSEVSGERYLCGVTGKKGRKPVDELTRDKVPCGIGALRSPLSPCQLVPLSTFPQNPNNNEENNRNYGNRSLFVFLWRKPEGSV